MVIWGICGGFDWTVLPSPDANSAPLSEAYDEIENNLPNPVAADLDGDGHAEVIFASWVEKSSNLTGKLHILDYLGNPLHEVSLTPAFGGDNWNGALAAPTLDNIDSDPDLEVVLNTAHSGVVAYDLPGTTEARILSGTGRGSYRRSGTLTVPMGEKRVNLPALFR